MNTTDKRSLEGLSLADGRDNLAFIQRSLSAYPAPGTAIGTRAEDPRPTRSAPRPPGPGASPGAGQGLRWEGRRAAREAAGEAARAQRPERGPTVPNGPGPGRRLECIFPKQTAAFRDPPPSPPAQKQAPAPGARPVSLQAQGRAGPQAPLPRGARISGSSSFLLRVHPHRLFIPLQRNSGPSLLTVSSFPFTFHLYEAYFFYAPTPSPQHVFHVSRAPVTVWEPIEAKDRRANRQRSVAHHGTLFPMVTGLRGGTGLDGTKALICANEDTAALAPKVPAPGAQIFLPSSKGGSLLGNWPGGGPGDSGEPPIGCLILSRCTLQ